jgi:hypothetical protein
MYKPRISKKKIIFITSLVMLMNLLYFHRVVSFPDQMNWQVQANSEAFIFSFVFALLAFMFFINLKMKPSRLINVLGGTCFAVYLIHENLNIRDGLLPQILNFDFIAGTYWIYVIPWIIGVGIFLLCVMIELARQSMIRLYAKYHVIPRLGKSDIT